MPVILVLGVLGAASAFLSFVLVNFWREATGSRRRAQQVETVPFCIACAQGWPHQPEIAPEDLWAADRQPRRFEAPVLSMNPIRAAYPAPRFEKQAAHAGRRLGVIR
jgi:hypothetical protein